MNAWRTLLGLGLTSILATACTVSTGTSDDEDPSTSDGDPFDYGDDDGDDDTGDDDTGDDDTGDDDTGDDDTGDDDTGDDDTGDDDTGDDDTGDDDTAGDDDTGDDDTAGDDDMTPSDFMCTPEAQEEGSCEQCVQRADRCCDERAACAGNPDCEAEWTALKECMAEQNLAEMPDSDPVGVLQECFAEVSGADDDLAVSDELFDLTTCVGTAYVPQEETDEAAADAGAGDAGAPAEAADDLLEGDGLCTFACYGVDTLEPVDVDEGNVDVR